MLVECLLSVCLLMVTLSLFIGIITMCCITLCELTQEMQERAAFNQLRMVFENDLFVRRRSPISMATNNVNRFCIGFWEEVEGEKKYLIYDFHLINDSKSIGRLTRNCFNQEALNSSETRVYCQRMISNITNGVYTKPNQVKF